jgi:hypothetical protein
MKQITLTTILLGISIATFAQNNSWSKNDRNMIYEDCLATLTTDYKSLTQDQRETVSLCFLNEITEKFNKDDYQNKIDAELRRIKSSTIIQCAKNIGAELNKEVLEEKKNPEPVKLDENKPTRKNLEGHWKDEESEFWLFETGDFKMVKQDGSSSKGTWKIDGDVLTLYHDKMFGTSQKDFKILMFTPDKFVYQSTKNKKATFAVEKLK